MHTLDIPGYIEVTDWRYETCMYICKLVGSNIGSTYYIHPLSLRTTMCSVHLLGFALTCLDRSVGFSNALSTETG